MKVCSEWRFIKFEQGDSIAVFETAYYHNDGVVRVSYKNLALRIKQHPTYDTSVEQAVLAKMKEREV